MNALSGILEKRTVTDFTVGMNVRLKPTHELYWRYPIGKVVRVTERYVHVKLNASEGRVYGFLPENIVPMKSWGFE